MFTKSGIMVGLGEERNEVLQVMDDLRSADVDFLTIGQYLQPTRKHHPVVRFVTPDEFKSYETIAYAKGFLMVVGVAADALVASCRRGFRAAARPRAKRNAAPEPHAAVLDHAPRAPQRRRDVRPGRRRRALSGIRAAVPRHEGAQPHAEQDEGMVVIVADMTVAYKVIRETFTSRVTLDRAEPAASWSNISTARSATWRTAGRFARPGRGSARSKFFIDYEFRSRMLGMLMGAMFDTAFRRFAGRRSNGAPMQVYGRKTAVALTRSAARRRASALALGADRAASGRPASTDCLPDFAARRCRRNALLAMDAAGPTASRRRNARGRPASRSMPPPGPAMPVTETARSTGACASAPRAIASAVSRLTAP